MKSEMKRSQSSSFILKNTQLPYTLSGEGFQQLIENSHDIFALIDKSGRVLYASPSTTRILGYPLNEFIGKNGFDLIHPDDHKQIKDKLEKLIQTPNRTIEIECRVKLKNQEWHWVDGTFTNLLENDQVKAIVVNYKDIDEQKKFKQSREKGREAFDKIMSSMGEGLFVIDKDNKIVIMNDVALALIDQPGKQLEGKDIRDYIDVFHANDVLTEKERNRFKIIISGASMQTSLRDDLFYVTKTGRKFPVAFTATPILLDSGMGYLTIFRDVTNDKEIDRMKSEFISLVSHQLKTPFALINGFIDNMLDGVTGKINKKQREYLLQCSQISRRAYILISDLLNVSRIERGIVIMHFSQINLIDIIESMKTEYGEYILKKGLKFDIKMPKEACLVKGDKDKFIEVLANVLTNAIKFTNRGSISVSITEDNSMGNIIIKDTGKGMDQAQIKRLFTRDQILSGNPSSEGGASLGMYIAKQFMDLQEGKIAVDSTINKGTSFTLSLPLD